MGETLDALRRLQEVEQQLAELRRGEDKRKRQIRIQKRNLAKSVDLIERKRSDERHHQMEVDRLDLDRKAREQALAKHRAALNAARTNKTYASILTVINSEEVDKAKLEARELEHMSEMEKVRAAIEKIEAEQAAQRERLADAERLLSKYLEETASRRAALERDRDAVAETIPPTALATFNRVSDRHDGEALAEIVRLHPKRDEYVCRGCNMKVTLEVVNALQTRDDIQFCDACGRLLYLGT